MSIKLMKQNKSFGGYINYYQHYSDTTKSFMKFSVYSSKSTSPKNAIIWLSHFGDDYETFMTRAGAQRLLQDSDTIIVCPDTSPRGTGLPAEHLSLDYGSGAGFYLNATSDWYRDHYNMYDYVVNDIIGILKNEFNVSNFSLMGLGMGGHGALILGLREKSLFTSISTFSPIVSPRRCEVGRRAFRGYFGEGAESTQLAFDSMDIVAKGIVRNDTILIDQAINDDLLDDELLTNYFASECLAQGQKLDISYQDGYQADYFFVASFLEKHFNFHQEAFIMIN